MVEKTTPTSKEKPYCTYPLWSDIDQVWVCCHGGTNCGGCSAFPNACVDKSKLDYKDYWKDKYKLQRNMEWDTPWKFCPWCGTMLAVHPRMHICGEPDID